MKLTIGKKMLGIGLLFFLGLTTLIVNALLINRETHQSATNALIRNQNRQLISDVLQHHSQLILTAMDAIINKDEGKISDERLKTIQTSIEFIQTRLTNLEQIVEREKDKQSLKTVQSVFPEMAKDIRHKLGELIMENHKIMTDMSIRVDQLNGRLDHLGSQIEKHLTQLFRSVGKEQHTAFQLAKMRNRQMALINGMIRSHAALMLLAMDAIIDKDEGKISDERMARIRVEIDFFSKNLPALVAVAETESEKFVVGRIARMVPELIDGIQNKLVGLIQKHATGMASEADFHQIDDTLDSIGSQIGMDLNTLFLSLEKEQKEASELVAKRNNQLAFINEMMKKHSQLMLTTMDAIIEKDRGSVDKDRMDVIENRLEYMQTHMEQLSRIADTDEEKADVAIIQQTFSDLKKLIETDLVQLIEKMALETRRMRNAFVQMDDKLDQESNQIHQGLTTLMQSIDKRQQQASQVLMDHIVSSTWRIIMVYGISLMIGGILFWLISRSIVQPLLQSVTYINQLADGDLTRNIETKRNDEIGMLLQAMIRMIRKLNDVVTDVKDVAGSVNASATQITQMSSQLNSSSEELSQGASEQAAAAEEASSSMEQMASTIRQNTENAMETEKIAIRSATEAKEGGEAVKQTVLAMKQISQKISIIEEIARQTDLLALNAAVEAARAGDHGKGFAVVASEVRKLAEKSQRAAREISELSITSVDIAEKAGAMLNNILPGIQTTAELVQEITAATKEQNAGMDQINKALQQLDQVTQQNAMASEELSSTAEELASEARQMTEVQLEKLQETISWFRTSSNKAIRQSPAFQSDLWYDRVSKTAKGYEFHPEDLHKLRAMINAMDSEKKHRQPDKGGTPPKGGVGIDMEEDREDEQKDMDSDYERY